VKAKGVWLVLITAVLMHSFSGQVAADDIVVVVNKENPNNIDLAYVAKIYSGAVRAWPDGTSVAAIDYPEDAGARIQFSAKVLNRSVANVRAIWSQNIFSGKGMPPKVILVEEEIKRIVVANKYSIAYMPASQVDSNMRVIAR
jgi:ABC-type phosphate transport system substrate-binding protein